MNLRELYTESIKGNHESLSLLIEFLVLDKKALTWESEQSDLDLYFLDKHKERMNGLLNDYKKI